MAEQKQNTNGFIEWNVTGDLLQQFKDACAKHKQVFCSPQFTTGGGTIWSIRFYPHGYASPNYCSIFLQCVNLTANKTQIGYWCQLFIQRFGGLLSSIAIIFCLFRLSKMRKTAMENMKKMMEKQNSNAPNTEGRGGEYEGSECRRKRGRIIMHPIQKEEGENMKVVNAE
eukprot:208684_1